MSLNSVKMLEISITTSPKKEILEYIQKYLLQNSKITPQNAQKTIKPLIIVTPNPEQIVHATRDTHFARILNRADVAIPDGIGIVLAQRFLRGATKLIRIPGVELMQNLVSLAANRGYPIGLIGGRGGVAVQALECLRKKHPKLICWAVEPEEIEKKYIVQKIFQTKTQMIFIGLGAPKQEYFIEALSQELAMNKYISPIVLMSVGGSFDIVAGRFPRAPIFLRGLGLEWLWRLSREPWRWRRQLALTKFLWLVVRQKVQA